MTNKKTTKRALLLSVVALLLCFTMLMGTTYAWFTDSVTSTGNKIVAGELDVQLLMHDGTNYVDISNVNDPIIGAAIFGEGTTANANTAATLWEPGKTQTVYLSIKNAGTLDLKYMVAIEVTDVTNNLTEVMQYAITPDAKPDNGLVTGWVADAGKYVVKGTNPTDAVNVVLGKGAEHFFALSVHMDEDAGNDYMNGSITFDIKVLATQLNSEEDSFGKDYDKNAVYPQGTAVIAAQTITGTAVAGETANLTNADGTFTVEATAGATGEVKATIAPISATNEAFTAAGSTGKSLVSYDVEVTGHEDGTPVTFSFFVGEDLADVVIFHKGAPMTDGTYSYSASTGYVTVTTSDFSPFEAAFYYAGDLPVAKVSSLTDIPEELEVGYLFEATEEIPEPEGENGEFTDEQIEAFLEKVAPYGLWHADFVVSFDKDVAEGAVVLGGQYDEWSETWVCFNTYRDIKAGERLRLLGQAYAELTNNENNKIYMNYAELCGFVREFSCGVGANDESVSGTTVTVELRLYETYSEEECLEKFGYSSINEETGKSVVIATYNYTFK